MKNLIPLYRRSPHIACILNVLIMLAFLLLTQCFFYILNRDLFSLSGNKEVFSVFMGCFRFALAVCIAFLSPYIVLSLLPIPWAGHKWYQSICRFFYCFGCSLLLLSNIADIIYYRFTFKRMTIDIFSYLGVGGDFAQLVPQFICDYWYMLLLLVLSLVALFWITSRIKPISSAFKHLSVRNYILSILLLGAFVICLRGGLQVRPLSVIHANQYTSAQNTALVLNTPFCIYRSLGKRGVENVDYFASSAELNKIFSPILRPHPVHLTDSLSAVPSIGKTNVIVIILEGIGAEYTSIYNTHQESYTPFLDSLAQHSWVFQGMANGKRSIDGIPAIVSSIPILMTESFITSIYGNNRLSSFAGLLKPKGYHTSFFHGGYNGSMSFNHFARLVGFDHYFGMNEYPDKNDYDGNWGIFDEPFLQFMAQQLNETPNPFASAVFMLSSHHPYTIPPQYLNVFKKGTLPIHETVGYSDHALRSFFDTISTMDWFNNTLFVITADHTSQAESAYFLGPRGMYEVPLLFYYPNCAPSSPSNRMAQHADILPGIMDFLGYDEPVFAFGQSPFDTAKHNPFHISYLNNEYQLIQGDYLFRFSQNSALGLYNTTEDPSLKHNLLDEESSRSKKMEKLTKAIIQQYNLRMQNNELFF